MNGSHCWVSSARLSVWWGLLALATAALVTAPAQGQTALPSTIEMTQSATLDSAPDFVEFVVGFRAEGATFEEAMARAIPFESNLREALSNKDLAFIRLEMAGPAIPDIGEPVVVASARLRFSAVGMGEREEGLQAKAALCDKIVAVCEELGCQPRGPFFGVLDKASVEAAAVERAMEDAYPYADAAARAIRAQIVAVDSVQIQAAEWHAGHGSGPDEPTSGAVACRVRVRVTYAFSVPGN